MLRVSVGAEMVYALCHTKPIFDFDYHNKRSSTPNNMPSRKRSNTYWSTNTFAPAVAICIARIICHRLSAAICIGRPICHRWRAGICIGQPICHPESAAICIDYTNMPPSSIWFTIHIEIHIILSKVRQYDVIRHFHSICCAVARQYILKASICTPLREQYILPYQYHSWLLLQYVLIKPISC